MQRLASSDNADMAWKRRCLDTREHVTFMAHEVDLAGRVVNVHDSSAGLSGGQRQKLVIFCLCPPESPALESCTFTTRPARSTSCAMNVTCSRVSRHRRFHAMSALSLEARRCMIWFNTVSYT